ncbi:hypothetical protein SDC9_197771 [bioreactor metagenome]|uniref:Uncharacterized protein n=1 Tax=bioreactor metagenome TaxID=1076179 RepID=A0A645IFS8_9ZZZZ
MPGKGCFVAIKNPELLREETLRRTQDILQQAVDTARAGGITPAELHELLDLLYEGE